MARRRRPPMMDMSPLGINVPLTAPRILMAANWVKDTTLLYGGSISTAYLCAGEFAKGLEREMWQREQLAAARPAPGAPADDDAAGGAR
jgi:hypothetical protein